jgi:hypothetical protein
VKSEKPGYDRWFFRSVRWAYFRRSEIMSQHHHKHVNPQVAGPSTPTILTKATGVLSDSDQNAKLDSEEEIRVCAYHKWETAGKPTGDGVQFWLEAEQSLERRKNEKNVQRDGWHGHGEHERPEDRMAVKDAKVIVDSHYRDNNRMFQGHGERGHRHGGSG